MSAFAGQEVLVDHAVRQLIQQVAAPGILDSPILKHPLDERAGGDPHHGGGQQFESQNDPAWQTLRAFVMGQSG